MQKLPLHCLLRVSSNNRPPTQGGGGESQTPCMNAQRRRDSVRSWRLLVFFQAFLQ